MKIFYHSSLIFLSLISFNSISQMEIGGTSERKKSDTLISLTNHIPQKRELKGSTEIFIGTNCSVGNRYLVPNKGFYGKPLGERANEKSFTTWSYALGFRNYIHKNSAFEGGISLMKNGESYQYKTADSSYNYQTTYTYIGMPLKIQYTLGDEIRLLVGGGLTPQLFNEYKQNQQWTTQLNEKGAATIKTKNGFNSFVISASISASLQIRYSKSWSIYITPEYRWQLNSSNASIDKYRHYARVLGINFGFAYQL